VTPLTLSRGVRYGLLLREICKLILSKINMGIKLTLDYIREYASSIGGILGQNNNYENNMQKLQFICSNCGEVYTCDFSKFKDRKKIYCNKCSLIKKGIDRRIDINDVREIYKKNGFVLLDEDYTSCEIPMKCMDTDGYIGYIHLQNVKLGYKFGIFKTTNPYYLYNLNLFCKLHTYDCEVLSWCINGKLPGVTVKCGCGNIYCTSTSSLLHQKCYRCKECSKKKSKNSLLVSKFLDEIDITYTEEKSFDDCKNILPLPFDFCVLINGAFFLIEVDGEYHYQPITGEENLKLQKERDTIKTNYCKKNNISLPRIPYWEIENNSFKNKIISEVNRQNQVAL
jgi:hypothetical protein